MKQAKRLLISLLLPFLAGGVGSLVTYPEITTWYQTLEKPFFNPPNSIFGPVWTTLYILIGISFFLYLQAEGKKKEKQPGVTIFAVQLVLNSLWSIVFFGLHSPFFALIVIVMLLLAIVMQILLFYRFSKLSSYLLFPYLGWVGFATILNFFIYLLNK